MATDHAANQVAIVGQGGLPLLVELLMSEHAGVQCQAAGALWSLALNAPDNQHAIAKADAVVPLVALLAEGADAEAQVTAAGALRSLAAAVDNRHLIAEAEGISRLVAIFEIGIQPAKVEAAGALSRLFTTSEAMMDNISDELVGMLSAGRSDAADGPPRKSADAQVVDPSS